MIAKKIYLQQVNKIVKHKNKLNNKVYHNHNQ